MPFVRLACQPASTDGGPLILGICRADEMVDGKAQGALGLWISGDLDVGLFPPIVPALRMPPYYIRAPLLRCLFQMLSGRVGELCALPRCMDGHHLSHD